MQTGFRLPNSLPICAAAALAFLSIGCGTVRHPALEGARDMYQKAQRDPLLVRNAGAALERARRTLETADHLWTEDRDVAEVEHLAYLVETRVEIARAIAERRLAAEEITQVGSQPRP